MNRSKEFGIGYIEGIVVRQCQPPQQAGWCSLLTRDEAGKRDNAKILAGRVPRLSECEKMREGGRERERG